MDHIAYAGMNPINGSVFGHVTYSNDWQQHYIENGLHRIDPTLHAARRSIAPVDWRRLERSQNFQTVFCDAKEFGISDRGLTIPVRGPYGDIGGLSLTRDCPQQEWDQLKKKYIGEFQAVAVHIHDMVIRSETVSRLLNTPTLSTREKEIMQWIAAGKSQQDIGDILSISHRTVEVHLRSARQKLYALTTPQAVGRAIAMGLIYPE
jgi:DNA-binding CsgD family transcriptional regulator